MPFYLRLCSSLYLIQLPGLRLRSLFPSLVTFPDDSPESNDVRDLKGKQLEPPKLVVVGGVVSLPSDVFKSKCGGGGRGGGSELTTISPLAGNRVWSRANVREGGGGRKENYINLSPHALAPARTSARLIKANDRRKTAVSSRPHENTTLLPSSTTHQPNDSNPASPAKAAARGLASLQLETLVTTKGTLFHAHPFSLPPPTELNEASRKIRQKLLIAAAAADVFARSRATAPFGSQIWPIKHGPLPRPEITGVIYAAAARRKHLWKCDPSSALMHLMMIYAASRKKGGKKR